MVVMPFHVFSSIVYNIEKVELDEMLVAFSESQNPIAENVLSDSCETLNLRCSLFFPILFNPPFRLKCSDKNIGLLFPGPKGSN